MMMMIDDARLMLELLQSVLTSCKILLSCFISSCFTTDFVNSPSGVSLVSVKSPVYGVNGVDIPS